MEKTLGFRRQPSRLSPSMPEVSKILAMIDNWLQTYGLTTNKNKSGILCVKLKKHSKFDPSGTINGYPFVETYKYLGVTIDRLLNFRNHIAKLTKKINFITFKLALIPRLGLTPFFFINLWQIFCKSLLDYGNIVYKYTTQETLEEIKRLYRSSLKKVLRISSSTPNQLVECLMGNNLKMQLDHKEDRLRRVWQEYAEPIGRQANDNRLNQDVTKEVNEVQQGEYDTHHLTWEGLRISQFYPDPNVKCTSCGEFATVAHIISSAHVATASETQLLQKLNIKDGINLVLALMKRGLDKEIRRQLHVIICKILNFMDSCRDLS